MIRGLMVSLCFMMLFATACNKGRYTDDRHYVGNPERPYATSESTTGDNNAHKPPNAESR
jgi:hypothetical protein